MNALLKFTFLSFSLNSLLDQKKFVDIKEIEDHIEDGSIFVFLKEKFGDEVDLSLYGEEERKDLIEFFKSLLNAVDPRRKFGVENNGITLLLAYCIEGIQELR